MALAKKPMIDGGKDEQILWIIARIFCLIVAFVFVAYVTFWKPECDAINKQFLACNFTGTVGDWIGATLFFLGLLFLSGIVKGWRNLANPTGSAMWNYIWFAAMAGGFLILWFL